MTVFHISETHTVFQNFDLSRRNMIRRAHYWVKKMVNAKQSIARLAEPFIPDGTVSCFIPLLPLVFLDLPLLILCPSSSFYP